MGATQLTNKHEELSANLRNRLKLPILNPNNWDIQKETHPFSDITKRILKSKVSGEVIEEQPVQFETQDDLLRLVEIVKLINELPSIRAMKYFYLSQTNNQLAYDQTSLNSAYIHKPSKNDNPNHSRLDSVESSMKKFALRQPFSLSQHTATKRGLSRSLMLTANDTGHQNAMDPPNQTSSSSRLSQLCSSAASPVMLLFSEHLQFRLEQLDDIPFLDSLYILTNCLGAISSISKSLPCGKWLEINREMIGINEKGKAKVDVDIKILLAVAKQVQRQSPPLALQQKSFSRHEAFSQTNFPRQRTQPLNTIESTNIFLNHQQNLLQAFATHRSVPQMMGLLAGLLSSFDTGSEYRALLAVLLAVFSCTDFSSEPEPIIPYLIFGTAVVDWDNTSKDREHKSSFVRSFRSSSTGSILKHLTFSEVHDKIFEYLARHQMVLPTRINSILPLLENLNLSLFSKTNKSLQLSRVFNYTALQKIQGLPDKQQSPLVQNPTIRRNAQKQPFRTDPKQLQVVTFAQNLSQIAQYPITRQPYRPSNSQKILSNGLRQPKTPQTVVMVGKKESNSFKMDETIGQKPVEFSPSENMNRLTFGPRNQVTTNDELQKLLSNNPSVISNQQYMFQKNFLLPLQSNLENRDEVEVNVSVLQPDFNDKESSGLSPDNNIQSSQYTGNKLLLVKRAVSINQGSFEPYIPLRLSQTPSSSIHLIDAQAGKMCYSVYADTDRNKSISLPRIEHGHTISPSAGQIRVPSKIQILNRSQGPRSSINSSEKFAIINMSDPQQKSTHNWSNSDFVSNSELRSQGQFNSSPSIGNSNHYLVPPQSLQKILSPERIPAKTQMIMPSISFVYQNFVTPSWQFAQNNRCNVIREEDESFQTSKEGRCDGNSQVYQVAVLSRKNPSVVRASRHSQFPNEDANQQFSDRLELNTARNSQNNFRVKNSDNQQYIHVGQIDISGSKKVPSKQFEGSSVSIRSDILKYQSKPSLSPTPSLVPTNSIIEALPSITSMFFSSEELPAKEYRQVIPR